MIIACVDCDTMKPCAQFCVSPELRKRPMRLQEYLLAEIFGVVTVSGHVVRNPVYRDLVAIHNLSKGIEISLLRTFNDDLVFWQALAPVVNVSDGMIPKKVCMKFGRNTARSNGKKRKVPPGRDFPGVLKIFNGSEGKPVGEFQHQDVVRQCADHSVKGTVELE